MQLTLYPYVRHVLIALDLAAALIMLFRNTHGPASRDPPAAILSIQLSMASTFGLLGVAVAAPLLAVLMVAVEMLYIQDILGDRNIEITGQEHQIFSS